MNGEEYIKKALELKQRMECVDGITPNRIFMSNDILNAMKQYVREQVHMAEDLERKLVTLAGLEVEMLEGKGKLRVAFVVED